MCFSRLAGLGVGLALGLATAVWAEVAVPPLQARVTDLTATLSAAQKGALEADLQGLEARSGSQLAVLLVPSTQPEAIEQYSLRVVEAWKLGKKGKDNGLLLLVAKNDRKVRIEVGYGLEGVIPDAIARRVIDETITPRFKQGDFAGGLSAGVQRLGGLIEERPAAAKVPAADAAPAASPGAVPEHPWGVMDLTETLSQDQALALRDELDRFYQSGRTKPVFILIVPTTGGEPIDRYGARMLALWGEKDNLDVDRSLLLVMAKDAGRATIEAGAGLRQRMAPGAAEKLVAETIEPQLRQGDLVGAVQAAVPGIEKLIEDAVNNKTAEERLIDQVSAVPIWLLVALAAVGTAIRWIIGPLFGALVMGGLVAAGAWYVAGVVEIAVAAGAIAFVFVLVGISNWIGMALSGSSGSGSGGGGGFSGGGGGFGGGGASGSW